MCIVSNTGGVGALTTDRADGQGMVVAPTSYDLGAALRAAVPGAVDVRNPVDLGADVTPAARVACATTSVSLASFVRILEKRDDDLIEFHA